MPPKRRTENQLLNDAKLREFWASRKQTKKEELPEKKLSVKELINKIERKIN